MKTRKSPVALVIVRCAPYEKKNSRNIKRIKLGLHKYYTIYWSLTYKSDLMSRWPTKGTKKDVVFFSSFSYSFGLERFIDTMSFKCCSLNFLSKKMVVLSIVLSQCRSHSRTIYSCTPLAHAPETVTVRRIARGASSSSMCRRGPFAERRYIECLGGGA